MRRKHLLIYHKYLAPQFKPNPNPKPQAGKVAAAYVHVGKAYVLAQANGANPQFNPQPYNPYILVSFI